MSDKPTVVLTDEQLKQIVEVHVSKLFEEDSKHFMAGYIKHISSKEKAAG